MNIEAGDNAADKEYAAFEATSPVEVGEPEPKADEPPKPAPKGPPKAAPAKDKAPVAAPETDGDDAGEEGDDLTLDEEGDEDEPKPKKTQTPSERIRELNKRLRTSERLRLADTDRLTALENTIKNQGLPNGKAEGNSTDTTGTAPNPNDAEKYPLGHLDDRYIEDKLEWRANKIAADQADAALQRQQENEQNAALNQQREDLLGKVDDLAARGADVSDDFQEAVVEGGMRGDWKLSQPTFEAAHEAEHGAQILYELSQNKAEADRVSKLSPYKQTIFVRDRNEALAAETKPRRIPGAGAPPQTQTRGANSRTRINPATDNLDDFEKAWEADAKRRN